MNLKEHIEVEKTNKRLKKRSSLFVKELNAIMKKHHIFIDNDRNLGDFKMMAKLYEKKADVWSEDTQLTEFGVSFL